MKKNFNKGLICFFLINIFLISFAIIYTLLFVYNKDLIMPGRCKFQSLFMLYCPGCGGSRSLKAFLSFDFISSFILYPPIIISLFCVMFYDIKYILTKLKIVKLKKTRDYYFLLIPISILLTFIVRNILLVFFKIDTVGDFIF